MSVTSPPDNSGIRAQKRSAYAQRYAWYKNATGTVVQALSPSGCWPPRKSVEARQPSPMERDAQFPLMR